jgi:Domain of unknown function (DUF4412)
MWKSLAAALTVLAVTVPAYADTRITYVDNSGKPSTQVYVKDGKVRAELDGNVVLYDAAKRQLTMLNASDSSYVVMDANVMQQMGMMMAARGGSGAAATGPKIMLTPLGSAQKVAGFACKDMKVTVDGEAKGRSCVAPLDSLGIPAADQKTLEAMRAGLKDMASIAPGGPSMTDFMPEGLALEFEGHGDQGTKDRETLKSISHGAVTASLFAVPAGYKANPVPFGAMQ